METTLKGPTVMARFQNRHKLSWLKVFFTYLLVFLENYSHSVVKRHNKITNAGCGF